MKYLDLFKNYNTESGKNYEKKRTIFVNYIRENGSFVLVIINKNR